MTTPTWPLLSAGSAGSGVEAGSRRGRRSAALDGRSCRAWWFAHGEGRSGIQRRVASCVLDHHLRPVVATPLACFAEPWSRRVPCGRSVECDRGAGRLVGERAARALHSPLDAVHAFEPGGLLGTDEEVASRVAIPVRHQRRDIAGEDAVVAAALRVEGEEVTGNRVGRSPDSCRTSRRRGPSCTRTRSSRSTALVRRSRRATSRSPPD